MIVDHQSSQLHVTFANNIEEGSSSTIGIANMRVFAGLCHEVCSGGCFGSGNTGCRTCVEGFELVRDACVPFGYTPITRTVDVKHFWMQEWKIGDTVQKEGDDFQGEICDFDYVFGI
mmetsp:Transcript_50056/g.57465  ORF Transcript_50056/g.57465 Transcript_50056/m.57465 type:complete len:117 (-) Transcript_50056:243-593(-)